MRKRDLIRRKLIIIDGYLSELEILSKRSMQDYLSNFEHRRAVERLIQVIVECACDCNSFIIIDRGNRPPSSYRDSFHKLGELGVISKALVSKFIPLVSLRNRIVHDYEILKNELVYANIKKTLRIFRQYVKLITECIAENSKN